MYAERRTKPGKDRMPSIGPASSSIVLHGINWKTYEKFLDAVGNRSIRLTYDRGTLEIMSPLLNHEYYKRRFGYLILAYAELLEVPFQGCGSTTLRREKTERGLEPDEGYYFAHVEDVLRIEDLDLSRLPPPDLSLEIDITSSSLDRLSIYAALGVPEVWRCDGSVLQVYHLIKGKYQEASRSLSLPYLPLAKVMHFIEETHGLSDLELLRFSRQWVAKHVLPAWQAAQKKRGPKGPSRKKRKK